MRLFAQNEKLFSQKHLVSLAITLLLAAFVVAGISIWSDAESVREEFDNDVSQVKEFISQRVASLETVLISLVGIHHSSDHVNTAEFSGISQEILSAYPYISSIVGIERVFNSNSEDFIARMEERGFVGFKIKSFDSNKQTSLPWLKSKLPINFIEPLTPVSAKALGYDIATSSNAIEAITFAIDTSDIASSGPIALTQTEDFVFMVFKAIYLGRYPPDNPESRREMLAGLVALEMRPEVFFKDIPFNEQELTISLPASSMMQNGPVQLAGNGKQHEAFKPTAFFTLESEQVIEAYGKVLKINLSRDIGFTVINTWKLATALLFTSVIIFLTFAIYRIRRIASMREEEAAIAIFEEGERFAQVIDTAFDAVITTDKHGKILSWNQQAEKIFGYEKSMTEGQLLLPLILSADSIRQQGEFINDFFSMASPQNSGFQIEVTGKHKDGDEFPLELSASRSHVADDYILSIFARDITQRKQAEEQIRQLAYYDSLTNLPNRQSFKIQAELAIKSAIRNNRMGAVLFIDLDEFKRINDTLGHDFGDLLIKKVSQRLLEQVRDNDTIAHYSTEDTPRQNVARLGGDEFTILLSEIRDINDASLVARRIQENIDRSFDLKGSEVYVTPSIGIAIFPHDGKEVDELLKNADTAMYHAKAVGKNNFQFYSEQMGLRAAEHLRLEGKLRKALELDELKLYYQPQISAQTGEIIGAEALLRWEQAELGMVSPAEFIPLAEDTGMILEIGDWVLQQACRQNAQWQKTGLAPIRVAVNLSGMQFVQANLPNKVEQALQQSGLSPEHLELEITESIIMRNIEDTIATLQTFRDMNLGVSVDDFGTGYSSLSYLKRFPLESLKIDRSFVKDIPHDKDDIKITSAILAMARSLNLQVVAEGVETEEQAAFLAEQKCDILQGFLYSKPLPANEFSKLLASSPSWKTLSA